MSAYRWMDLSSADRIICFRPQSHLIRHPKKVLWFIHHLRTFYDLWDSPYRGFPDDSKHLGIRDALHATDTIALHEAHKIFTNSQVVSNRLLTYNKVASEVLYPPIFQPERFHCKGYSDEVVYICRIEHHKRQHLLIEAMKHTKTPVRLRICGLSSNHDYIKTINKLIDYNKKNNRVILENRWISEEEKVEYLSNCLAAAYLPLDEDSYGYPSLEASHASKAILTTSDSGGVTELVTHRHNGLISEPDPRALAGALDQLYTERITAMRMGAHAKKRIEELNISWEHVVSRLLS